MFKKLTFVILSLILIISIFAFGYFIGKESQKAIKIEGIQNQELGKPDSVNFNIFWEVWKKAQGKFINSKKIDSQKMMYGAIGGMIRSLGDPYTVFMNPDDSKRFLEDVSGKFEGIGAEIGMRKNVIMVIAPLKNTPAEKAGLFAGDKILKIDNKLTTDLNLDEAVNLIRGPKNTSVKLTILRDDLTETQEITIKRDVIEIPSLKLGSISNKGVIETLKQNDGVAYLSLYQFSEKSLDDFKKSAENILKSKPEGIILDLRNNPGGYLDVAQDIASLFLKKDELVATEQFSDGSKKEYRARGNAILFDFPIVIIVNQGSASASEILAGTLRDNRHIKLIGETTFGKGSVQELEKLQDGSSLKITVAKWLTPSGYSINEKGLEPDIKIEISAKDLKDGKDPQLDKAIEILKNLNK